MYVPDNADDYLFKENIPSLCSSTFIHSFIFILLIYFHSVLF